MHYHWASLDLSQYDLVISSSHSFSSKSVIVHPPTKHIEFLKGEGQFVQLTQKQRLHEYVLVADNDVLILENTNYFPGWEVFTKTIRI